MIDSFRQSESFLLLSTSVNSLHMYPEIYLCMWKTKLQKYCVELRIKTLVDPCWGCVKLSGEQQAGAGP